jgi:hypothetical protein
VITALPCLGITLGAVEPDRIHRQDQAAAIAGTVSLLVIIKGAKNGERAAESVNSRMSQGLTRN